MFYFLQIRYIQINLAVMTLIWLTCSFNAYMLCFTIKYFPGTIAVNGFFRAVGEFAGYLSASYVYQIFGVRRCFVYNFTISSIAAIAMCFYQYKLDIFNPMRTDSESGSILFPILVMFAQFGTSACFNACFMSGLDLFPVLFSGTAFGFCNFLARFFTFFSPQLAEI